MGSEGYEVSNATDLQKRKRNLIILCCCIFAVSIILIVIAFYNIAADNNSVATFFALAAVFVAISPNFYLVYKLIAIENQLKAMKNV